jgi:hypothetical protein
MSENAIDTPVHLERRRTMKLSPPPRSVCAVAALVLGIIASPLSAVAGTQEQLGENASSQINAAEPIGQTFTADGDPNLVSIGFGLENSNSGSVNSITTVQLYEGVGVGGTLVASVNETLPDLPAFSEIFYDFDFSGENVQLTPGQVYTALIFRPNARWSLQRNNPSASPFAPDYVGGHLMSSGVESTTQDATFRVVTAAAVPLLGPLGALVLMLGLLGTGWRRSVATRGDVD